MLESTCTLPLTGDLFAQAIHPSAPVLAVGLSTGHVQTFRIPSSLNDSSNNNDNDDDGDDDDDSHSLLSQGRGEIETQWRTKRHNISCRAVTYSSDGETLYSAGADGIIKAASAETGKVVSKIVVPAVKNDAAMVDACSMMHVLSPQTLLLATDHSCALHVYDLRSSNTSTGTSNGTNGSAARTRQANGIFSNTRPAQTWYPHNEYISSLTPLPASSSSTSGFAKQWISTGGTTLAVTDLRKGIVAQSADQDDELTASCFVTGLPRRGTSVGEKAVVGDSSGVLTLWERGVWDDIDERIVVDRSLGGAADGEAGESVEILVNVPTGVSNSKRTIAAGMGGGLVAFVQLGPNKVVESYRHDEVEAVLGLGFDVEGRMISGGGQTVKIWSEKMEDEEEEAEEQEQIKPVTNSMNGHDSDSDNDSADPDNEASSEDERPRKKRKKGGKGGKGKRPTFGMFKGLD